MYFLIFFIFALLHFCIKLIWIYMAGLPSDCLALANSLPMAWNGPSWIWTHRRAHTNCLVAYRPTSNFLYFIFLVWIISYFCIFEFLYLYELIQIGLRHTNQPVLWNFDFNHWQIQTMALSIRRAVELRPPTIWPYTFPPSQKGNFDRSRILYTFIYSHLNITGW